MPLSIREEALGAMYTLLSATPGVVRVERDFPGAFDAFNDLPALVMFTPGEEVDVVEVGCVQCTMQTDIEAVIRASSYNLNGAAISALLASIIQQVATNPTLGGYADDVRYAGMTEPLHDFEGESEVVTVGIRFDIIYSRSETDPFSGV